MAISARDELAHILSTLTDAECERALELLAPLTKQEGDTEPPPLSDADRHYVDTLLLLRRQASGIRYPGDPPLRRGW